MSISFATPWTVARQAPLSMGFSGTNTGVGCHFLLEGIFPTQGWTHTSCIGRQILYHWATREALMMVMARMKMLTRFTVINEKSSSPMTSTSHFPMAFKCLSSSETPRLPKRLTSSSAWFSGMKENKKFSVTQKNSCFITRKFSNLMSGGEKEKL